MPDVRLARATSFRWHQTVAPKLQHSSKPSTVLLLSVLLFCPPVYAFSREYLQGVGVLGHFCRWAKNPKRRRLRLMFVPRSRYPFLLPNLVGASCALVIMVLVIIYLPETKDYATIAAQRAFLQQQQPQQAQQQHTRCRSPFNISWCLTPYIWLLRFVVRPDEESFP